MERLFDPKVRTKFWLLMTSINTWFDHLRLTSICRIIKWLIKNWWNIPIIDLELSFSYLQFKCRCSLNWLMIWPIWWVILKGIILHQCLKDIDRKWDLILRMYIHRIRRSKQLEESWFSNGFNMFYGQHDLKESSRRTFIQSSFKKRSNLTTENTNMLLENLIHREKDQSIKQYFEREVKVSPT